MAAVHENQSKRRRRSRQTRNKASKIKVCSVCEAETRWLSVDGKCWNCTVESAKSKIPIHIDQTDEEQGSMDSISGTIDNW